MNEEKEFNLTGTMSTPARLTRANERAAQAARAAGTLTNHADRDRRGRHQAAGRRPRIQSRKVNPAAVDKKISELVAKVALGLKENQMGRQLVLAAKGDGFRLLELMDQEAKKATDVEESLVAGSSEGGRGWTRPGWNGAARCGCPTSGGRCSSQLGSRST